MIDLKTLKAMTLGTAIADAVGVPVEFERREFLKESPVTDMLGYGTYNQPAGTWSDDTSLTLATMESITRLKKIDYVDLMNNFALWYFKEKFTATGERFDCGITTSSAIKKYSQKIPVEECGATSTNSNGNGSLMRILPAVVYLRETCEKEFGAEELNTIHKVSALTHAHPISKIGCGIYALIAVQILEGKTIAESIQAGLTKARQIYIESEFKDDLQKYSRLWQADFGNLPETEIKSSGYVIDTLEAALWCLLNTKDYKMLVLKAVNLGGDTDTVASVAGGLACIYYGLEEIPEEWFSKLQNRKYLEEVAENFFQSLKKQ